MGNQRLHNFDVKNCDRDNCEHCGLGYWRREQVEGIGEFGAKVHCDSCIEAERTLDRICTVMNRTQEKMLLLKKSENNKREEFVALLTYQRAKMKVVLTNIRNFTKEQSHSNKEQGSESRLPYKE